MGHIAASSSEAVTGTGLAFLLSSIKNWTKIYGTVFRHCTTAVQNCDPWEWLPWLSSWRHFPDQLVGQGCQRAHWLRQRDRGWSERGFGSWNVCSREPQGTRPQRKHSRDPQGPAFGCWTLTWANCWMGKWEQGLQRNNFQISQRAQRSWRTEQPGGASGLAKRHLDAE